MQRNETLQLAGKARSLPDLFAYILEQARGKSVLNVGASGGVETYLPDHRDAWLHWRIGQVARELTGIDIDRQSIDYARRHGVELICADCETMELGRRFDLIIMTDVIEHLNSPGLALPTLMRHLNPGGKLILTTPNPTSVGTLARACLGKGGGVYYDHVTCFSPETVLALCRRFGYRLGDVYFFTLVDRRTAGNRIKSACIQAISAIAPRLHNSFLAEVHVP